MRFVGWLDTRRFFWGRRLYGGVCCLFGFRFWLFIRIRSGFSLGYGFAFRRLYVGARVKNIQAGATANHTLGRFEVYLGNSECGGTFGAARDHFGHGVGVLLSGYIHIVALCRQSQAGLRQLLRHQASPAFLAVFANEFKLFSVCSFYKLYLAV